MSNEKQVIPFYQTEISKLENDFIEIASKHKAIDYKAEALFACQLMGNNAYLADTASKNPTSMRNAVMNVAAIGITLNPVLKLAYLVPREGKVCLDIGYQGLVKLAVDVGSISWASAEVVYEKDSFSLLGFGQPPQHIRDPFSKDRGKPAGIYCVAKTLTGEFLTATMSISEIEAIRDRTSAWKAVQSGKAKSCPWSTDFLEMAKKTVIKRASKMWPHSGEAFRLQRAIDVLNNEGDEGIDFVEEGKLEPPPAIDYKKKDELVEKIKNKMTELTNGLLPAEKGATMIKFCKVSKFAQINLKSESELEEILSSLNENGKIIETVADVKATFTTKDIAWNEDEKK